MGDPGGTPVGSLRLRRVGNHLIPNFSVSKQEACSDRLGLSRSCVAAFVDRYTRPVRAFYEGHGPLSEMENRSLVNFGYIHHPYPYNRTGNRRGGRGSPTMLKHIVGLL